MACLARKATCRHEELGPVIGRLFGEIMHSNSEAVLLGPPMVRYLKWEPEMCEIEAACWVEKLTSPGPESELKEIPGCTAAMYRHVGPYEGLPAAWARFWEEFNAEGILAETPCWDAYVTNPVEEPDPLKWITELYIPVRRV